MKKCKIPKLSDYKTVTKFVRSIDSGDLKEIPRAKKTKSDKGKYQMQCDEENDDLHPSVSGCCRSLETFLTKLASL